MLNYIKAELYRNFNRVHFWAYTCSIAAFALFLNILIAATSSVKMDLNILFAPLVQFLILPVFLVAAYIEIATAEEHKNLTLKNAVAFGAPRSRIALSKVIVTVILSFIGAIIIYTVYLGSGALLFGIKESSIPLIADAWLRILAALPLWIGAISVGTFIALFINNSTAGAFVYAGAFTIIAPIIKMLSMLVSDKFGYIYKILITPQFAVLKQPNLDSSTMFRAAGIGIIYTILFTVLSMVYIRKKEIK